MVDATNVEAWARAGLLAIAGRHGRRSFAIVFDLPLDVCLERNAARSDRVLPARAIRRQHALMAASLPALGQEGFASVWRLADGDSVAAATVQRIGR